jgi:hypothetical protein
MSRAAPGTDLINVILRFRNGTQKASNKKKLEKALTTYNGSRSKALTSIHRLITAGYDVDELRQFLKPAKLSPLPSASSSNESSGSGSGSGSSSKTQKLKQITNMGISNSRARAALNAANGDVQKAVHSLFPNTKGEAEGEEAEEEEESHSANATTFTEMIQAYRRVANPFTPYMPVKISGGTGNGPCMYNSVFRALSYHPFGDLTMKFKVPRKIRDFLNEYVFTEKWTKKYEYTYYAMKGTKEQKRAAGINSAVEALVIEEMQAYQPDFVKKYFKKPATSLQEFIEMVKRVKSNPDGNSETWGSNEEMDALKESLKTKHNIILFQYSPKGKISDVEKQNLLYKLEEENGIDIRGLDLKPRGDKKPKFARFFYEENSAPLECDRKPVHPCDIPARLQINIWYNGINHYEGLIPESIDDKKVLLAK